MNIDPPAPQIEYRTAHDTPPREVTRRSDDTVVRERPQAAEHQYKVRIGHTEMTVNGRDPSDAVRNARRRLAGEMPRLWDVIYRMSDEEFRVEEVR